MTSAWLCVVVCERAIVTADRRERVTSRIQAHLVACSLLFSASEACQRCIKDSGRNVVPRTHHWSALSFPWLVLPSWASTEVNQDGWMTEEMSSQMAWTSSSLGHNHTSFPLLYAWVDLYHFLAVVIASAKAMSGIILTWPMTNIPIQAILWPSLCKLLGQPLQDVKGLGLLEAPDTTALAMPNVVLQASTLITTFGRV